MDDPEWVHYVLQVLTDNQLRVIAMMEGMPMDLIETGGGAASNTVISPSLHKEFCTPYDRQLHDALHSVGIKVVYHLCGGLMKQLDNVLANGADGLETMTPPGMGGDCDLAEATRLVGDKLFFVGGFNQKDGFERGTPKRARELVLECHAACPDGGFIISPSDHFFHGAPECIQSFADAAKECLY
jgi:uroporphyrinogen-III decarboxylase